MAAFYPFLAYSMLQLFRMSFPRRQESHEVPVFTGMTNMKCTALRAK